MISLILIAVIVVLVIFFIKKKNNKIHINTVTLTTGVPGTGKTSWTLWSAIQEHQRKLKRWKREQKILKHKKLANILNKCGISFMEEKPVLYSNIKLAGIEYTPLTFEVLKREKRTSFHPTIFCDEASLLASSQEYKDKDLNERLNMFNKLIRHEGHGDTHLFYNTQNPSDIHFSIKRVAVSYYFIAYSENFLFFWKRLYIRELLNSNEMDGVAIINNDKDQDMYKKVIMPKKVFNMYDSFCYSCMTDDLEKEENPTFISEKEYRKNYKALKQKKILTFKDKKE